jgi:uncharacterized delta-60 repeat protein
MRVTISTFVSIKLFLFITIASAQNISLDTTFGTGGIARTFAGTDDNYCYGAGLQSDKRIVIAGYGKNVAWDYALLRYESDGVLDSTFGGNGIVLDDLSGETDQGQCMLLQPDEKIIVAGNSSCCTLANFSMARYMPDGSRDTTFGSGGIVIHSFDPFYDYAYTCALQSDGKIVLAGTAPSGPEYSQLLIVRYTTDGILDSSFGNNGVVLMNFSSVNTGCSAEAMVIQPDDKILVAGPIENNYYGIGDFALTRLNADGSIDFSFGNNGAVITDAGFNLERPHDMVLQPDGKIIVAGNSWGTSDDDFIITRYLPNGAPDLLFGTNGIVIIGESGRTDECYGVLIQPDGKILTGGSTLGNKADFYFVRLLDDGTPDSTFDGDGKFRSDIGSELDACSDIILQPDGKIIAAGVYFNGYNGEFVVARYNNNVCLPVTASFAYSTDGQEVIFSDSSANADSWYWDFGDGNTSVLQNPQHIYSSPGEYEVCLIVTDSCTADTICETITLLSTAVSEILPFSQFVISPNPFSIKTTIKFYQMEYGRCEISIFDLQGRKMKTITEGIYEAGNHSLDFYGNDFTPGVYLVHFEAADKSSIIKITKL